MSADVFHVGEACLCYPNTVSPAACTTKPDSNRLALLSEYLALQPSLNVRRAVAEEQSACRSIDLLASRLNYSRQMQLPETPDESELVDSALARASERVSAGLDSVHTLDDLNQQQRVILAMLYPAHPSLESVMSLQAETKRRVSMLRKAIRDQTQALSKLNDASNLLLLISDHVEILNSCYASSCTSSSSEWSSEDDLTKVGCLSKSDEPRSKIFMSSVPGNYRMRYLRRCWGFAADALASAVDLSSFLAKQLEVQGRKELVPGIDSQARPSMSLFELPGGLTLFFRSDLLQKMFADAKSMRGTVQTWQFKQRKFVGCIRRELSRSRKKSSSYEAKLADLRRKLMAEEFASSRPYLRGDTW